MRFIILILLAIVPNIVSAQDTFCCFGNDVILTPTPQGQAPFTYTWICDNGQNSTSATITVNNISAAVECTLTTIDANLCSGMEVYEVGVASSPIADAGTNETICSGDSATLLASANGGTPGYSYSWSDGGNNPHNISPSSTTSYIVTVTDILGCTDIDQITITVQGSSCPSCPTTAPDCIEFDTQCDIALADLNCTFGSLDGYTLQVHWASTTLGQSTSNCEQCPPNGTTIILTFNFPGDEDPFDAFHTYPIPNLSGYIWHRWVKDCCQTFCEGPEELNCAPICTSSVGISNNGNCNYSITGSGCSGSITWTLNGNIVGTGTSVTVSENGTLEVCRTNCAASCPTSMCASTTVTGCEVSDCACTPNISNNGNCTVSVSVSGTGCSNYTWSLRPRTSGCSNAGVGATLSSGTGTTFFNYSVDTDQGYEIAIFGNSGTGCASSTDCVDITGCEVANCTIQVFASSDQDRCFDIDGALLMTSSSTGAQGSVNRQWQDPDGINLGTSANQSTNGKYGCYTITYTDSQGCTDSEQVCINSDCSVIDCTCSVTLIDNGNCTVTASLNGTGCSNYDRYYLDSPSNTTIFTSFPGAISVSENGNYSFRARDLSGATNCGEITSNTVNITGCETVCTLSASITGNDEVCSGSFIDLTANPSGNSYQWSTGAGTQSITISAGATYTVTVTDNAGCTDVATKVVSTIASCGCSSGAASITDSHSYDAVNCEILISTATIGISTTSGCVPILTNYTVSYSDGSSYDITANTTLTTNGLGTYTARATGLNIIVAGCTDSGADMVESNSVSFTYACGSSCTVSGGGRLCFETPNLTCGSCPLVECLDCQGTVTANAGIDQTICNGETRTLSATGGISYSWSNGQNTQDITVTPSSTTTYTVTATDSGGCTDTDQVTISVNQNPTANAGNNDTICNGDSKVLSASGGTSYNWSNGSSSQNPTVNPSSTTTYTVTVTDGNGCTDTDQVIITVLPTPNASAGGQQNICSGDNATLSASGGGTYVWSTGATTQTITVSPTFFTTYTVTVTAANGCTDISLVNVFVHAELFADAGINQILCNGESTTLLASASGGTNPNYSYAWSNGSTVQNTTVSPTSTTTYTLTVTEATYPFCTDTDEVTIAVVSPPVANAGIDQTVCAGDSANLTASGGGNYEWSTGQMTASITVSPSNTTTYTVTVYNNYCNDTDEVIITVDNNCN